MYKHQPLILLDFVSLRTHTGIEEGSWASPRGVCDHLWVKRSEFGLLSDWRVVGPPLTWMEGAQTNIEEEGAGLPLWVSCDQSWASLGLPLAYTYIPGVQNVESMGVKV